MALIGAGRRLGWYWAFALVPVLAAGVLLLSGLGRGEAPAAELPPAPAPPALSAADYLRMGTDLLNDGQWDAAARALAEARALEPGLLAAYIHGAQAMVFGHHYDEALALAEQAVALAPRDSAARATVALVANWLGDSPRALREARRAVDYDGANALAHAYVAEAYTDQYKLDEAQAAIDKALELDADDPEVARVSGYLLETRQLYAVAIDEYVRGIAARPYWTHLHVALGHALRVIDRYADAEAVFLDAARIEPTNPRPIAGLGMLAYDQEQYRTAIEHFQQAIEIDPEYSTGYGQLGVIYYQRRDYPRAQPMLERAVELERNAARGASYRHALGWIYLHAKQHAQAREQFAKALELNPSLTGARDGLALAGGR